MAKDIAKKTEAKLAALNLELMEQDAIIGTGDLTQDDLATPRLKILQPLSPELQDIEDARPGMIYNSVTETLYKGSDGVKVIPCAYQRDYVEWVDRGKPSTGKPVNLYTSSSDILTKTTRDENNKDRLENGNYIETCANHYVLLVNGEATPAVITFKSTQFKKSKKWNSMMLNLRFEVKNGPFIPPSYSHYYRLKTVKEGNDKGNWFGWEISREEQLEDVSHYKQAKQFAESVSKGEVKVKHEQEVPTDQKTPF